MLVGMELPQENDSSVTFNQEEFTKDLKPIPTSPGLWASSQRPLSSEEIKLRECKLGELCWLATASRPNISTRLARIPCASILYQAAAFIGKKIQLKKRRTGGGLRF